MRFQSILYTTVVVLAASLCLPAAAAPQVYFGLSAARFTDDDICKGRAALEDACKEKEIDTSAMGYIGLKLPLTSFGVEVGHIRLPEKEEETGSQPANAASTAALDSTITYGAVTLNLAIFPGIKLSLMGGLGQEADDIEVVTSGAADDDEREPFYGLGVRVSTGGNLGLAARYQTFRPGDDDEISGISLGLEYKF